MGVCTWGGGRVVGGCVYMGRGGSGWVCVHGEGGVVGGCGYMGRGGGSTYYVTVYTILAHQMSFHRNTSRNLSDQL